MYIYSPVCWASAYTPTSKCIQFKWSSWNCLYYANHSQIHSVHASHQHQQQQRQALALLLIVKEVGAHRVVHVDSPATCAMNPFAHRRSHPSPSSRAPPTTNNIINRRLVETQPALAPAHFEYQWAHRADHRAAASAVFTHPSSRLNDRYIPRNAFGTATWDDQENRPKWCAHTHTYALAHTHTFQRHSSLLALNYIFTPFVWRMATLCNLHAKHWCDCRTTRFRMCVCVCCRHCVRTVAHRRRTAAVFAGAPRWRRITNWYELTQSIAALSRPRSRTQPRILSRERERFDRTDQPTVFN